jgi:hypothetical protein
MYLLLSFVAALISLYYLGVMVDSYNPDTTYLTPLVSLLIYSIVSIIRNIRKEPVSWLTYDDDYGTYNDINSQRQQYNDTRWNYQYGQKYTTKATEKTEYFLPDKKEKKEEDDNKIIYYPSRSDVREKIKELEKSRWFRIKKILYSLVFIDLTERYRKEFKKPYKINRKGKVVSVNQNVNKEDHSRFTPNNSYWANIEKEEYDAVAKLMGRSCEIALTEEEFAILSQKESNNSNNKNEQQ